MQKILLAVLIIGTSSNVLAGPFVPTPPVRTPVVQMGGCAFNDCTETRLGLPASLPSPALDELAPSAGSDANFCRDVNLGPNTELCKNEKKK